MKIPFFLLLIIVTGCFSTPSTSAPPVRLIFSKSQVFLSNLKDSLILEYSLTRSEIEKQKILENYHQQLEAYLTQNPMDSMKVTIDEVLTNGLTISTRSHLSGIEFQYGLTFNNHRTPRIDSIYMFMNGLKPGSDTLVNLSFTGACQVNRPDSEKLAIFRIYAFPVPLQYTGK